MTAKKVLMFILGLLTMIGGMYCAATPGLTYLSMVWVIGFVMFFHAIENIMTWSERKAAGIANGWNLAGAIISLLCGLLIIISGQAELVTGIMLLYFLFGWLIAAGVIRIVGAFKVKGLKDSPVPGVKEAAKNWGWIIVAGVLMIIAGCFGFAHPVISAISIGFVVGIDIIAAGIDLMIKAFTVSKQ